MDGQHTKIVPCGKCVLCLKSRQRAWSFRLHEEMKHATSACFLTLTYETPPLSPMGRPTLHKPDYQNFMKRLRKHDSNKNRKLKYYAVGEYGDTTHRPHYHAILYNCSHKLIQDSTKMEMVWGHGIIHIGDCNMATISYTTKYVMKGQWEPDDYCDTDTGLLIEDDRVPQFSLMSKKLGYSHLTPQMVRYYTENLIGHATMSGGVIVPLPRYFKEKIFTSTERKQLADQANELRELDVQKKFDSAIQEVEWKRDQTRKQEKLEHLKRNKL